MQHLTRLFTHLGAHQPSQTDDMHVVKGTGLSAQALSRKLRGLDRAFHPHQAICFFEIPSKNRAYAVALTDQLIEKALVAKVEEAATHDGVQVYTTIFDSYKRAPTTHHVVPTAI